MESPDFTRKIVRSPEITVKLPGMALLYYQDPLNAFAIVVTSWMHQGPVIGYLDGRNRQTLGGLVSQLRFLDMGAEITAGRRIDANIPAIDWMKEMFLRAGYRPYYDEAFMLYDLKL